MTRRATKGKSKAKRPTPKHSGHVGRVATIIVHRDGKAFIHQFDPKAFPTLQTQPGGVLTLSGGFHVDSAGFIHNGKGR